MRESDYRGGNGTIYIIEKLVSKLERLLEKDIPERMAVQVKVQLVNLWNKLRGMGERLRLLSGLKERHWGYLPAIAAVFPQKDLDIAELFHVVKRTFETGNFHGCIDNYSYLLCALFALGPVEPVICREIIFLIKNAPPGTF